MIQRPGEDPLLHPIHIIFQLLEVVEVLCNQPFQKLTEEAAHAQLPLGIPLLQMLDRGAGCPRVIAQYGPFLGEKIAESNGSAVLGAPRREDRPAQAVMPKFCLTGAGILGGGRMVDDLLQTRNSHTLF